MSALWLGVLAHLWQTTLVLLVLGMLALVLRRAPARYQEWLWTAALLKLLIPLPLVVAYWPTFARLGSTVERRETIGPAIKTLSQLTNPELLWVPPVEMSGAGSSPMPVAASILWGLGVAALLSWWWRQGQVSIPAGREPWHASEQIVERVTRAARAADVPLSRVRIVDATVIPCVRNVWRPLVVLSTAVVEKLGSEELRAVLVHEEAHRRRGDLWRSTVYRFSACLFFFYPPAWWLQRKLQQVAELSCDEAVLAAGIDPRTYARALASTVSLGLASSDATALARHGSSLHERLGRIHSPGRYRTMNRHRVAVLVAFLTAGAVSFVPVADGETLAAAVAESQEASDWVQAADIVGLVGIDEPVKMRRSAPLWSIFEELGELAGFDVYFTPENDFGERTLVAFTGLPVREALALLAEDAGIEYLVVDETSLLVRMGYLRTRVVRPVQDPVPLPPRVGAGVVVPRVPVRRAPESEQAVDQPYWVGGDIREPEKIHHVDPVYPELARRARLDGFVLLQVLIDKEGNVRWTEVLRGLGLGLDEAATDAVSQWRYTPTLYNGEPVEVLLTVRVVFQLIQ